LELGEKVDMACVVDLHSSNLENQNDCYIFWTCE